MRALFRWSREILAAVRERHMRRLRHAGLQIGADTYFPDSTFVDLEYAHLIRIGSFCGFGAQVMLLARDNTLVPFGGGERVGSIVIHDSCHIGARTIVHAGVEIGPMTVVSACSVVRSSLPPRTFCAGNPARPYATLEQYLDQHRKRITELRSFPYDEYDIRALTPERRDELVAATLAEDAYIVGGRTAELQGRGGTPRTTAPL